MKPQASQAVESPADAAAALSAEERALLEAVRGTRFGAIEVTVHDGHVVQIIRSEKVRFAPPRVVAA